MKKSHFSPIKQSNKELQILELLADSRKPLSTRDIEKKILGPDRVKKGKRDAEVYTIIKDKLCVQKFNYSFFIFDWDELVTSIEEKEGETTSKTRIQSTFIKNLNKIGLGLSDYDYNKVTFSAEKKENNFVIKLVARKPKRFNPDALQRIKIERNLQSKNRIELTRFEYESNKKIGMTIQLAIKKVGENEQVFYEGIKGNPKTIGTSYLNRHLKERHDKAMHRIVSENPALLDSTQSVKTMSSELGSDQVISDVFEITSNKENYNYSINTRGLIAYLLGKMEEEEKEGRDRNVEISNLLTNLSENYKQEFPFLIHYNEIKELYDKMATDEGITEYRHFQIEIISKIALALQYEVDTINKAELDYYIIKQYSDKITERFVDIARPGSRWAGMIEFIPVVIRKYLVHNLDYMREYLQKKLATIEYDVNRYGLSLSESQ